MCGYGFSPPTSTKTDGLESCTSYPKGFAAVEHTVSTADVFSSACSKKRVPLNGRALTSEKWCRKLGSGVPINSGGGFKSPSLDVGECGMSSDSGIIYCLPQTYPKATKLRQRALNKATLCCVAVAMAQAEVELKIRAPAKVFQMTAYHPSD
eukprot:2893112-Amphidinium_carterae.1